MDAPGVAEPDWKIMAMMAQRMESLYRMEGKQDMAARFTGFNWETSEEVFRAAAVGVKGAQEDYGETTYAMLKELGTNGVQTPIQKIEDGKPISTVRLYEEGGRFTFIPAKWPGFPEPIKKLMDDERYPFWVNNGRANHGWQTLYDDLRKPYVMGREPLPFVEIHPRDAGSLRLEQGDLVELFNPYGSVTAMAVIVDSNRPGHVFMLFEHPKGWLNSLTTGYVDPDTTIPYYKGTKAGIRKIGALSQWQGAIDLYQDQSGLVNGTNLFQGGVCIVCTDPARTIARVCDHRPGAAPHRMCDHSVSRPHDL